ncbi:MAG: NAD-dependent epimerase [Acidobacteriaceae bacterium]|nr:NAD-dependent epimerase [Acidobacteriaceae bacterium]
MVSPLLRAPVLITGGLGFIGSNLARTLAHRGADVTVMDSLLPNYGGNLHNVIDLHGKIDVDKSDVRDQDSVRRLVKGKRYLFNLAGQTSHMDSMTAPLVDLEINTTAQISILETCRVHNPEIKIVFASTRQIYGKPDYLPVDECHPIRPVDVNGINKLSGEWYHILYNNVYGLRSTVLRLTNTYGPRMRVKDARQMFMGIWMRLVLEEKPFEVWEGQQKRDFNYVDDVTHAMLLAATSEEANGKVFNLGADAVTLNELADCLVDVNGGGSYHLKSFPEDRKRIDIGDYYGDYTRISRALGWSPQISLREGISRSLDYYRNELKYYI